MNGIANGEAHCNGVSANGVSANGLNGVLNKKQIKTNGHIENNPDDFLTQLLDLLVEECVVKGTAVETKVVDFKQPTELKKCIDFNLRDEATDDSELIDLCQRTIKYSVKTGHPRFFNQLYSGLNQYGLGGALLTEALNTSSYTYEVAPVFTLMEQVVLQNLATQIGYDESDGIFCPGGSVSNMYGLNVARYQKFPQIKTEGMHSLPRLCVLTSAESHYSIKKGAAFLGIGMNNIRIVKCDKRGKMIPEDLEKEIMRAKNDGLHPYFVHATAGTTVIGAYDPIDAIADICEKHDLWLHIDAAWGGGAFVTTKHRHLIKGAHRADSIIWNQHKMMGAPLQCCAFITKHKGLLQDAHSAKARYLFQQDKCYDVSYDTGDKSIQCGRKVDVFKLWLMWKAKGHTGFQKDMDHVFEMARFFAEKVKTTEGFRIVYPEPECTNVCFWYIPPSLRGQEETKEWWEKLSKVAPQIKEHMVTEGTMLIGYQPHGEYVNFFRMVVSNPDVSKEDMLFAFNEIHRLGKDL